jgi:hypothetical protein
MRRSTTQGSKLLIALAVPLLLLASGPAFADKLIEDKNQPDVPGGDYINNVNGGSGGGEDLAKGKGRRTTGPGRGGDNVVVPEPGTIALLGLGLAGLGLAKRRRAKK